MEIMQVIAMIIQQSRCRVVVVSKVIERSLALEAITFQIEGPP